jgi:pimeloyl-ACP methyl ester carboxylesterase
LRRHGSNVRAAVLMAVAPVDELYPLHSAQTLQRALDMLCEKCHADADCNAAFPNLSSEFQSLFEHVRKGVEVEVRGQDGRLVRVRPSPYLLAQGISHLLYYDDGRSFPTMIHHASSGDLAPLIQMVISREINDNKRRSIGTLLSVSCAEKIPFIDDATLTRETAHTFLQDLRVKEERAACDEWVRGPVPPDVHQLVRSDIPVLLLSGNRDPVTPPAFAERLVKQLPNSKHIVFPEASHGNWGSCGYRIIAEFIDRSSVTGLDVSCVSQQTSGEFVIGKP